MRCSPFGLSRKHSPSSVLILTHFSHSKILVTPHLAAFNVCLQKLLLHLEAVYQDRRHPTSQLPLWWDSAHKQITESLSQVLVQMIYFNLFEEDFETRQGFLVQMRLNLKVLSGLDEAFRLTSQGFWYTEAQVLFKWALQIWIPSLSLGLSLIQLTWLLDTLRSSCCICNLCWDESLQCILDLNDQVWKVLRLCQAFE